VLLLRPFYIEVSTLETKTKNFETETFGLAHVSRPRQRPFGLGLQTKDRDLGKMNSSALASRDLGLEITTLVETTGFTRTALKCFNYSNVFELLKQLDCVRVVELLSLLELLDYSTTHLLDEVKISCAVGH